RRGHPRGALIPHQLERLLVARLRAVQRRDADPPLRLAPAAGGERDPLRRDDGRRRHRLRPRARPLCHRPALDHRGSLDERHQGLAPPRLERTSMSPQSAPARIDLSPGIGTAHIDPKIYGHFLESAFFGNIEGGVFDEGSELSVCGDGPLAGCRQDVINACRELGMPVVRWPGGNFTSAYWWQDGTGPRDQRPRRLELAWGSEESNRFGTPEFLSWCEATGATPYLAHGCRSVEDAVRWVEYTNYTGDTEMTRRRAADGLDGARAVPIWGIGNEVYGPWQMGHRSPEQYAQDALEHAKFMRAVDGSIRF